MRALFALLIALPAFGQAHYRHEGQAVLNDLKYTPGAVRTTDVNQLCPHAGTKAVRHVTPAEKKQDCRLYGLKDCSGKAVEFDHLISLELGGANSLQNLWPEPYAGPTGARTKDKVEDWLHGQVCSGKMPLSAAQHLLRWNWIAAYRLMERGK